MTNDDKPQFTLAQALFPAAHIRALTAARRIKPTSTFRRSARRPNPGRGSTYPRGDAVQTTGTSSVVNLRLLGDRIKHRPGGIVRGQ